MPSITIDEAMQLAAKPYEAGQFSAADEIYRQIITQQPNYSPALHMLGLIAFQTGRLEQAVDLIARAAAIDPHVSYYHGNLGECLRQLGRLDEALPNLLTAIKLKPDFAEAHCNLGILLRDKGQIDEAMAAWAKAIQLKPIYPQAYYNMGIALAAAGKTEEAIVAYARAIDFKPDLAEAQYSLGNALKQVDRFDEAMVAYRRAIELKPDFADAHNNLGNLLSDYGRIDEALDCYKRALASNPTHSIAGANLLYTLHLQPAINRDALFEEHQRWADQHAKPFAQFIQPHANDRNPQRKLRIGYVSPDLRDHVVGRFLLPLLANHNKTEVEVFCYSARCSSDPVASELHTHADIWRDVERLSDSQACEVIRDDGIDILVDLSGHTSINRLLLFARKPTPIQVTYLGYPDTTGMDTMDYRITDAHCDPIGRSEQFHTEKLVRLPNSFLCFCPPKDSPTVAPSPFLINGHITFGCFNVLHKINADVIGVWSRILQAVPNAKLLLKSRMLAAQGPRHHLLRLFAEAGIAPHRLDLRSWAPSLREHLQLYNEMDIALDTFPYGGTTTTCEALWMGVPVITLAGESHVTRVGVSILSNVGLPELVAKNADEYVEIAVELAGDLPRLKSLRSEIRNNMSASPLMNGPRFAANIEAVYRQMWQLWCTKD